MQMQGPGEPDVRRAIASLQRLADRFAERRRQLAREAGLSEAQWRVLEEVAGESFMPSLFAKRQACSAAAVSRTLRQLLEAGLVSAGIGAQDGRQRVYRLTAQGRRRLARVHASRAAAIAAVWSQLDPAELRAFARFADALSERLEAHLAGA